MVISGNQEKDVKAGNGAYTCIIKVKENYCWISDKENDTTDQTFAWRISPKPITINKTLAEIDYSDTLRTWSSVHAEILKQLSLDGVIPGDDVSFYIKELTNGNDGVKYLYDNSTYSATLSTSYTAMGLTVAYAKDNFIGSTYSAKIDGTSLLGNQKQNYTINSSFVLKYKTAQVGSGYFTIEDALAINSSIT